MKAPGHNPDNLTVEQVGEGYRLLDHDEILDGVHFLIEAQRPIVDMYFGDLYVGHAPSAGRPHWLDRFIGLEPAYTYRTKFSRAELRRARGMPAEHNPQQIHPSKLPPGCRFLDETEIMPGTRGRLVPLRMYDIFTSTGCEADLPILRLGDSLISTYCTDMTREQLAEARAGALEPLTTKPRHPELCVRYGTE